MAKDFTPVPSPKGDGCLLVNVDELRELQPLPLRYRDAMQSALMPSILDKAFKGEL